MTADVIFTTPLVSRKIAAQEAADVIKNGGGLYFRNVGAKPRDLVNGETRIYYVEAGYIRGFCVLKEYRWEATGRRCHTTGSYWAPGHYLFMDATTWQWIKPIGMQGFQGWRYMPVPRNEIEIVGGWLDPMPVAYADGPSIMSRKK